jgi:hypothetical protein
LLRPELAGLWHAAIWIAASDDVRSERMLERNGIEPGSPRAARYTGAAEIYEREAHPMDAATAIVGNTDPARPRRR